MTNKSDFYNMLTSTVFLGKSCPAKLARIIFVLCVYLHFCVPIIVPSSHI